MPDMRFGNGQVLPEGPSLVRAQESRAEQRVPTLREDFQVETHAKGACKTGP